MARYVANVDIITDSFEIWLLETNELLNSLSTEIITANSTYANTGNSTFDRTAQLYGTFGANNLVVSNWMKGGNVNGQFANLYISTNAVVTNTNATEIRLEVANGSSNSFLWQYGLHAGLGTANLVANTTKLTVQSNSTVNSTANSTMVRVANSTSSANVDAISFRTGIFQANTIEVQVGANVIANSSALLVGNSSQNSVMNYQSLSVGNSTVNTFIVANSTTAYIDTDGYVRVLGNADFSNTMLVVGAATFSNTVSVDSTDDATSTTGSIQTDGGASVAKKLYVGGTSTLVGNVAVDSTTDATQTAGSIQTDGGVSVAKKLYTNGAVTFANTLTVNGNITAAQQLTVTNTATFSNTTVMTGNASFSNIATFQTEYVVDVYANGNLGSTTGSDSLFFQFPKATYSSAKIVIQVKNSGNTQISEMLVAHDTTDAYLTTYGTVSSPPSANSGTSKLATFSASCGTANVRIYVNQTTANSSAKAVVHFIK